MRLNMYSLHTDTFSYSHGTIFFFWQDSGSLPPVDCARSELHLPAISCFWPHSCSQTPFLTVFTVQGIWAAPMSLSRLPFFRPKTEIPWLGLPLIFLLLLSNYAIKRTKAINSTSRYFANQVKKTVLNKIPPSVSYLSQTKKYIVVDFDPCPIMEKLFSYPNTYESLVHWNLRYIN